MAGREAGKERGQVLALTAVLMIGILAAVGLAVDAGLVFSARRYLQGAADAAAAAAAQQIDVMAYRGSQGQVVQLDPSLAYAAAVARLEALPQVESYTVQVSATRVDVTVRGRARLAFLPALLPLARTVPVGASAWAVPRYGIVSVQ
jgi:uncharacterized membrane protein